MPWYPCRDRNVSGDGDGRSWFIQSSYFHVNPIPESPHGWKCDATCVSYDDTTSRLWKISLILLTFGKLRASAGRLSIHCDAGSRGERQFTAECDGDDLLNTFIPPALEKQIQWNWSLLDEPAVVTAHHFRTRTAHGQAISIYIFSNLLICTHHISMDLKIDIAWICQRKRCSVKFQYQFENMTS